MSMQFEIELSDLTEDAVRRLLKDAVRQQARNSLPIGKRGKKKEEEETCGCCGEPECECEDECEDENAVKVAMNRRGVEPSLPKVNGDDLPKGMNLSKYKAKKNVKKSK